MKYIFKTIRWILGQVIIVIEWATRPKAPTLSPEVRAQLDQQTANLKLYQFQMCPFCVITRRTIHRLGLNIETRDARNDPVWNAELISEGGKYQVPCLRIGHEDGSVQWLYESADINRFLKKRFSSSLR